MVFAILTMLATGVANAQPPKCDTQITACGCTIGAPGSYTIENALYASQGLTLKNGCIDIEGQNIDLYAYQYILGAGSNSDCSSDTPRKNAGVGIHVLPSASNVSIYVDDNAICGWNYGVESEGHNINWYYVGSYYNNVGMFLDNATDNNCLYCLTGANVGSGVQIVGGSGNSFNGSEAYNNGQYGFWIDGSKENMFTGDYGYSNTLAGFYLGCNSKGNVNPTILCPKNTPTTQNSLLSSEAFGDYCCSIPPQEYGIEVERGSIYNTFNENDTFSNTKKDMIDGNGNCIYNTYLGDTYSTKSPNCIQ